MVRYYRGQKYSKLHDTAVRTHQLFTDPLFPPSEESLGFTTSYQDIVWKRPPIICDNPKLVNQKNSEAYPSKIFKQGDVGNCWFVAACSCLASQVKLWKKVIPDWERQEWDSEDYGGIFHFQFWRMGEWVDVVIDDYLPTKNGELVYMTSQPNNEFWSALLEKAYAKLAGSYEALAGVQIGDALVDFTGGVNEAIKLKTGGVNEAIKLKTGGVNEAIKNTDVNKTKLFEKLEEAHTEKSLISFSIAVSARTELNCGLKQGHTYVITEVLMLSQATEDVMTVKIMSPWGENEWSGLWNNQSQEWERILPHEEDERRNCNFYMKLDDCVDLFTDVSICRQIDTYIQTEEGPKKKWHSSIFHGEWRGRSAGGSVDNEESFLHNPQYMFKVPNAGKLMVNLMQKDADKISLRKNFAMGVCIMRVEENRVYRVHVIQEKAAAIEFTKSCSVFGLFTLQPGTYVVVPSTREPGQQGLFLLRLFSESCHDSKELIRDIPTRTSVLGLLCCCCWRPALVTVHLENANISEGTPLYCIVKCGGKRVRTPVPSPTFGTKVNFYIRNPASAQVTVQVHFKPNPSCMRRMVVPLPAPGNTYRITERLMAREGRRFTVMTQGTLTIRVDCSADLRSS